MSLWKILGLSPRNTDAGSDLPRGTLYEELETLFSDMSQEDIRYLAGFSGLLGRVAVADMDLGEGELARIREILSHETSIPPAFVDKVISLIKMRANDLFGAENVYYTRLLNETVGKRKKIEVLGSLFAVAAADHTISAEEEAELRLIATGLWLTHSEFIDVRIRFKEFLAVFRK